MSTHHLTFGPATSRLKWRGTPWIILLFILGGLIFQARGGRPLLQKDVALPTKEPPHRVWIIGDSITRGLHASSDGTTYRTRIFLALGERYPAQIYATFWQGVCTLGRLEQRWGQWPGRPDVLFLELGINDVSRNPNCPQIPEGQWAERYGAMLDRIRRDAPGVFIVVGTLPWPGWKRGTSRYQKALLYNEWIREAAQARDIPVADLWEAMEGRTELLSRPEEASAFPPAYRGDGFHPNDQGHRVIAETFLQAYWSQP